MIFVTVVTVVTLVYISIYTLGSFGDESIQLCATLELMYIMKSERLSLEDPYIPDACSRHCHQPITLTQT
jgi:hypothetical protein